MLTQWIDTQQLSEFIIQCQNQDEGSISDRPGNLLDIFHTFFEIGGLLLLGYFESSSVSEDFVWHIVEVDPAFALPNPVVQRLGLRAQTLSMKWNKT